MRIRSSAPARSGCSRSPAHFDVALENAVRNLTAADMTVQDIVKVTYCFVDEVSREERAAIVARHFR